MKMLMLFLLTCLSGMLPAQDTWKVTLNDRQVLKTSVEDADRNIITIAPAQLRNKKEFLISYTEADKKEKWVRSLTVYSEKDAEVYKHTGTRIKIKNSLLMAWLKKYGSVKIYTWALPSDPKMKQLVRVRRVHLCTLVLEK